MATYVYDVNPYFVVGQTLGAYAISGDNPDGIAPPVAATATAVVSAAGTVTYTALADGTHYWLGTGSAPYQYIGVQTAPASTSGSGGSGSALPTVVGAPGTNLGATPTLNLTGQTYVWHEGTLNANAALTVSGFAEGTRAELHYKQDATGGRTLSVNDGSGATALVIPTAAAAPLLVILEWISATEVRVIQPSGTGPVGPTGPTGPPGPTGPIGPGGTITTIKDEGSAVTSRTALNFIGASVTVSDNAGTSATDVTISGGATVSPLCGTGADGDVTVSGTTTLVRDVQYNNLAVTGTLNTNGWRVSVRGTLTGNGVIRFNALDGQANGTTPATAGNFLGGGGSGGAGGTAAGAAGGTSGSAAGLGASGAAGGTGSSGAGGAGGTISGILAVGSGVALADVAKINPFQLWTGHAYNSSSLILYGGGCGGGGGGGDGTAAASGGQGGGIVIIAAFDASAFTGTIHANGGAGGSPGAGNRGGGGGGGGGLAALFAATLPTGAYTISANGGAAGTGFGTGTNGTAGSAGTTIAKVL